MFRRKKRLTILNRPEQAWPKKYPFEATCQRLIQYVVEMSQGQHINDRKVAGAIYTLKDCHMCNLNPQIGAFPRCVGIYLTNDIWNCRRKKHFRTHNKDPATTKRQPCERKPHPAIFHKHHNNAPGTLSTMTELLTHPDCLKKHQQLKLEKAKVSILDSLYVRSHGVKKWI